MKYALAIDIGASSGRHIVGWVEDGKIRTKEVYRFPNGMVKKDGHFTWNIAALLSSVKTGIAKAKKEYAVETLSIDTWGVDYVILRDKEEILPVYTYRDSRTENVIPKVHEIMPFVELYRHTGCQFQPFNSIYQLYADKLTGRLDGATDFLMIPEYLMYKLCGTKAKEFTNATTTGMVDAATLEIDREIVDRLGLPERLFSKLQHPGTVIGEYDGIRVMLCATHDTGSAVEGIPMEGENLYISSGTWSLLGVKTPKPITDPGSREANFSNEGGVGYNRYQKNIMGMWLVNELRLNLCPRKGFSEIVREAENSTFERTVNANAREFLAPYSMKTAFDTALHAPMEEADYFRCAFLSLAQSYAEAIRELEANTGKSCEKLYIVGGGAKNAFLNRLTEEATGKQVIALPIEATAIGNLKIQLMQQEVNLC